MSDLRAEEILESLDNEQRAVALATRGPVCVIAGAGTGKTRAITHRIAYAAAINVMDPHKVLALTFTARAAGEMRMRLRSLGVPSVAARTIHAAALKQLTFFWPQVFGGRTPDLITSKTAFITEAIKRAELTGELSITSRDLMRDIASEIEWSKVSEVAPVDYLSELGKRTVKPRINPEQMAKVYTAYESVKHQERAMDFEDVLLLTTAMIEQEREVRERVQDQYRFFTVDEYQDISPLQQRLINAWLGSRQEICVVGDPAQTIYSFAGATPVFLNSFTQRFPEAEVVRLTTGYRSTPGTLTWALQNQRLAKPSTCSVAGTVRCKETRTTRLCGLGGQSPPTSCALSSRWRIRHLRCPFAGLRPPASSATPLCFARIRVFASSITTSPSHRKDWHSSFMSRPAGATSLLRFIDLATTRFIISFAIGCACAAPLAKFRYGRFPTDSMTPSHHRASTGGFRRLVTS